MSLIAAAGLRGSEGEAPTFDPSVLFANVCAACHGAEGQGNPQLTAPSIAGLPAWFVEHQLEKFRHGIRGGAPEDMSTQMAAIAKSLPADHIPDLAQHVASLPVHPTASTRKAGDPERGRELYMEICAQCHRYNGQGERVFHSAPLTTLPDWYLYSALRKFQKGERGNHPDDVEGAKMKEVTRWLPESAFDDLVAWIATLAEKYPPGEKPRRGPRRAPSPTR